MASEAWPVRCPDCGNDFLQPFVCITCGAAKLHDAELDTLRAQVEYLTRDLDAARCFNHMKCGCGVTYNGQQPTCTFCREKALDTLRAELADARTMQLAWRLKAQDGAADILSRVRYIERGLAERGAKSDADGKRGAASICDLLRTTFPEAFAADDSEGPVTE